MQGKNTVTLRKNLRNEYEKVASGISPKETELQREIRELLEQLIEMEVDSENNEDEQRRLNGVELRSRYWKGSQKPERDRMENVYMAESRLASLKRKLAANEETRRKYSDVIEGYIEKRYAEPVPSSELTLGNAWYLSHHPVIHPHKEKKYVDGGISDNLPSLGDDTITVSPFSGESDICPPSDDFSSYLQLSLSNTYIQITPSNLYRLSRALFPPDPEILRKMCEQGFDDTLKYLQKNTIIPCNKHIEHYRSASVPSIDITPQQQKEIRKYYTSLPRHASTPNIRIGPYQQNPPQKPQEEDMQQEDTPRDMQRQPQQRNRCNSEGTNRDNNNDFTLPRSFFGDELTDICEKEELWLEWTDEDFFSEDEVDGEDDSTYHCEDCRKHTHHLKVIKKLPPPVIAALEEASNSVNKGLMNYIYNNRIYQAISLFTLPYILPIETALTYSVRFAKWLPYLPADSQWFLCGLGSLIKYIIGNLNSGRHEFSARFSCQLAVTEDLLKPLAGYPVTSVGHASAITDCDTCSIEALDIATSPKKRHNFNFRFAMEMTSDLPDSVLESFDMCEDVFTPSHPLPTSHINEPCSVACDTFDYTLRMTDEMDSSAANHYLHVTQTVNHETNESHVSVQEV